MHARIGSCLCGTGVLHIQDRGHVHTERGFQQILVYTGTVVSKHRHFLYSLGHRTLKIRKNIKFLDLVDPRDKLIL